MARRSWSPRSVPPRADSRTATCSATPPSPRSASPSSSTCSWCEAEMDFLQANLLSLVIFFPLLGAVAIAFLPRDEGGQHKGVALIASLITFVLSIPLATGFRAGARGFSFEERGQWAPNLGFSYHVGIDGVALLLLLLTTFLGPIVVLSSWKYIQSRVKLYCASLLFLETAMIGTLAALDLVLFYVFWEAMLIPMYLLIGIWGSDRRIYAAVKFFLFTFVGSVLMCMAQQDLKRLIAYSSVAHLGFVMLGLSALTPEAVNGAVLQMVNHGISTGALFLLVGYFYERTHTRDLAQYGGVARVAPALSAVFLVVVLSSIGLPGTNGFVGEFLILIGTFASTAPLGNLGGLPRGQVFSVIAATGVVLGAG